jgi:signal recognition particle subunit SRP54
MGEKLDDLQQFYPDRMASRILGMGDVLSFIEKAEAQLDEKKAAQMEQKLRKAEFDYNDYLEYMGQIKDMGGIGSIMSMLPTAGLGGKVNTADIDMDEAERNLKKTEAIILSMTSAERSKPELLNPSRKNRIARGAGVDIADVNRLVKSFDQMKKMMKQMPGMMKQFGGKKGKFKLPF